MDKSGGRAVLSPCMERSGVTGKSLHQVSASRRDASVVDAISCTTESSLRDSIIMYHACPCTPLRSMHGYDVACPSDLFIRLFPLTQPH